MQSRPLQRRSRGCCSKNRCTSRRCSRPGPPLPLLLSLSSHLNARTHLLLPLKRRWTKAERPLLEGDACIFECTFGFRYCVGRKQHLLSHHGPPHTRCHAGGDSPSGAAAAKDGGTPDGSSLTTNRAPSQVLLWKPSGLPRHLSPDPMTVVCNAVVLHIFCTEWCCGLPANASISFVWRYMHLMVAVLS